MNLNCYKSFYIINIEELDNISKFIENRFVEKIKFISSEISTLLSNIETLEGYFHYIDGDLYNKSWDCLKCIPKVNSVKSKTLISISDLFYTFSDEILKERTKLFSDIESIQTKFNTLKTENDLTLMIKSL